ncbi:hypothetical protein Tco_1575657 [Tanacetum coccineum]
MTSPVIDLVSRPDSSNVHWPLPTTTTTTAAPTTTTRDNKLFHLTNLNLNKGHQIHSHKAACRTRTTISTWRRENQSPREQARQAGNRFHMVETMDRLAPKLIREATVENILSQEIDPEDEETVNVVISSVKHAMRAPLRAPGLQGSPTS